MKKQKHLIIVAIIMIIALLSSCNQTEMITCNACGASIASGVKFCPECGANFAQGTTVTSENTATPDATVAPENTAAPDATVAPDTTATIETPETAHVHAWSDWNTTLEATCTEEGKQERSCSCGEKETQSISVIEHKYVEHICTVCGSIGGSEGLSYTLSADGTYYSVSKGTCTDANIFIASSYKGLPVTTIGDSAFSVCTNLTSITIPDSVTSICDYAFYGCTSLTNVTIPDSVTSIGNSTFIHCTGLTSVTIGNNVTSIGSNAFYDCSSLASVTIGNSVTSIDDSAFFGCKSLTRVTIPEGVTSIGNGAFSGCSNLVAAFINNPECQIEGGLLISSVFSSNVVVVSDYNSAVHTYAKEYNIMFVSFDEYSSGCKDLAFELSADGKYYTVTGIGQCKDSHVVIPCFYNNLPVRAIAYRAFYNCTTIKEITIPQTVTDIGTQILYKASNLHTVYYNSAYSSSGNPFLNIVNITKVVFNGNSVPSSILNKYTYIKEIVIGDRVSSIGEGAFRECTSLTSVTIGNSVTSIGYYVFYGCTSLTSVTIGNNVAEIGFRTFENCTSLASITIPDSVTSIGQFAFANCTSLTSINLPNSITSLGGNAFNKCTSLTSINLPNSITIISNGVFSDCTSFTSITIPDSVTSIDQFAFSGCASLKSITIPDSVTSIDIYAFYQCTSLTSINIPDSVTSIGGSAFNQCTRLKDIYYTGTEVQWKAMTIGNNNSPLTKATIHYNSKN